jgi:hypothetical protein
MSTHVLVYVLIAFLSSLKMQAPANQSADHNRPCIPLPLYHWSSAGLPVQNYTPYTQVYGGRHTHILPVYDVLHHNAFTSAGQGTCGI